MSQSKPISLSKACRETIPQYLGKTISPQAAYRWVRIGLLGADGVRVKLAAYRVGRNYVTSETAVSEFFDELRQRSHQPVRIEAEETNAELRANGLVSPA